MAHDHCLVHDFEIFFPIILKILMSFRRKMSNQGPDTLIFPDGGTAQTGASVNFFIDAVAQ